MKYKCDRHRLFESDIRFCLFFFFCVFVWFFAVIHQFLKEQPALTSMSINCINAVVEKHTMHETAIQLSKTDIV